MKFPTKLLDVVCWAKQSFLSRRNWFVMPWHYEYFLMKQKYYVESLDSLLESIAGSFHDCVFLKTVLNKFVASSTSFMLATVWYLNSISIEYKSALMLCTVELVATIWDIFSKSVLPNDTLTNRDLYFNEIFN